MNPELLDPERIRTWSGERRFELGKQALASCVIERYVLGKQTASARIDGHEVSLRSQGEHLEGACSCPDSDGFEFCSHCVVLALYAGKSIQQLKSLSKGPDKSKVMAYLLSLDHQELAKQMLLLIEGNPQQFKRYVLKASLEQGEPDYAALKKELTRLTKADQSLFSQRQFRHYFSRIERFLEEVGTANFQQRPESMLRLIEYAITRMNSLLDKMEDRSQQRQKSCELLADLYRQLFDSLQGRDDTRCKRFEKIWLSDRHQILGLSVAAYFIDARHVMELFGERLLEAWQRQLTDAPPWLRKKMARYLLEFGELEAGLSFSFAQKQDMREALMESDQACLQVAKRWLQEGFTDQAMRVLEDCLSAGSSSPEIVRMLAKLYGTLDTQVDRVAELFACHTEALAEVIFECFLEAGLQQGLAARVLEILQQRQDSQYGSLQLRAFMELERGEEAVRYAQTVVLDNAAVVALVKRYGDVHPQLCTELLQVNIQRLLGKAMISADKKAAELMVLLHAVQPTQQFEGFVEQLQPLIRLRPKFVESYEQSASNRLI